MQVTTLSVFRFRGLKNKLWAFSQMQFAHKPMQRIAGLTFYKLLGSGSGESFTPIPNFGVYAILANWTSLESAEAGLKQSAVYQAYRRHAEEEADLYLTAFHSVGAWGGENPFKINPAMKGKPAPEPIGALTRASIRTMKLRPFWKRVPAISQDTIREQDLLFKIGIGEIPWLHQVTFSVWSNRAAMMRFAYQGTCHAQAAKAARDNDWFCEDLFARFEIMRAEGSWQGRPMEERLHAPVLTAPA